MRCLIVQYRWFSEALTEAISPVNNGRQTGDILKRT
jgi:hypothetical protein